MLTLSYETFTLDNGLKVIIHEDHSVAKAVLDVVYRVGAKDEDPGRTGFAHLFEHLMFEGSKHIPHYDTPLQRVGGQNNAFTNNDITNYYISVPSNQLETAFWLESDRMLELAFSQKKLDIQKSVVIEEFKQRYLNQPYGDAYNRLRGLHFTTHPYRWPTIGMDISHIEEAKLEEVESFFFGFYAPNNATLVVAGDVNPDEVKRLAEKWFGPIPSRALRKHDLPTEPKQTEPRTMTVHGKVPFPAVYKMYHIPANGTPEYYVADLLTDLLSNGRSGILYQEMVKKHRISPNVSAFVWGHHHPGMASIDGKVAQGHTVEAYEKALAESLAKLQDVTEADLTRVKGKVAASFVMQKTNLLNKAIAMAIYDVIGDPNLVNTLPDIYEQITLNQVYEAAATYFDPNNCSTLYYLPETVVA